MKRLTFALSAILFTCTLSAQSFGDFDKEFEQFKKQANTEYEDFRQRANAEYAEFLKSAWRELNLEEAIEPPKVDPPVQPIAPPQPERREGNATINPKPLAFKGISRVEPPKVTPFPKYDIPKVEPNDEPFLLPMSFNFFGETCSVRLKPGTGEVQLPTASNQEISDAWKKLSDGRFDPMFADCMAIRKELNLNDWGYFQLAKRVAEEYCEAKNSNNSKILQAYLMTQAGYKIRMGKCYNKLFLFFPYDKEINGACWVKFDNGPTRYWLLDEDSHIIQKMKNFEVCYAPFPGENSFSLALPQMPKLPDTPGVNRTHKSVRYPNLVVDYAPNKNLIDFFSTYPLAPWEDFAHGSLSERAKSTIYPTLKKAIEGKSEIVAANILINFVQTGFKYMTDGDQFGRERPLFGDETFYYPYSDCEDRAILYSILMRDLLGVEAALIHYPGHLAAAICFSDGKAYGDYIEVDGKKYTISDPTYIGASVGQTMPNMNNAEAKIIIL